MNKFSKAESEEAFGLNKTVLNSIEYMRGAVIRFNETLMIKIIRKKMIFYVIRNNQWIKTEPISAEKSKFKFPSDVFGVYQSEDSYVYYFRKFRYCKRHINDFNEVCLQFIGMLSSFLSLY